MFNHNSFTMYLEDTLKSFLTELIVPIVRDAINGNLVVQEEEEKSERMTYKEIEKEYYVSRQTVDRRSKNDGLTKIKNGRRVLFYRKEVDAMFKERNLAGVDTKRFKNKKRVA